MKQTINFSQFVDGFSERKDNFSYAGLRAMFDYFTELEDDCGTELEFDSIAICCEYTEDTITYFSQTYGACAELGTVAVQDNDQVIDWLRDRTQVIVVDENTIIIQDF